MEVFHFIYRIHVTETHHISIIPSKPILLTGCALLSQFSAGKGRENNPFFIPGSPSHYWRSHSTQAKLVSISALNFWDNTTLPYQFRLSNFSCSGMAQPLQGWFTCPNGCGVVEAGFRSHSFLQGLLLSPPGLLWDFSTDSSRTGGNRLAGGLTYWDFSAIQFGRGWTKEKESSGSTRWLVEGSGKLAAEQEPSDNSQWNPF